MESKKHVLHGSPDITIGNQAWAGAAPALARRPISRNHSGRREGVWVEVQRAANRRDIDPNTWTNKYLMADSCSLLVLV